MNADIVPTLPFGDINLVVLTDVHSWVAGHGNNEGPNNLDVTYGDVVSFYEQLKEYCRNHYRQDRRLDNEDSNNDDCGDLWLVQNGDWIDGTGLATSGDPSSLIPILEKVPFDVLNTGNHELYIDSVIETMRKPGGFLQWWGPRHLASNIYMNNTHNIAVGSDSDSREPLSNRYHVLHGRRSTVLVFGFIYNLPNPSNLVTVQTVEEAVQESWFREVLTDTTIGYDAILVMLHAGHDDPSVEILRQKIRRVTQESGIDPHGNLPVQFIAGHTHYRRYAVADPQSTIVEAGRYMDTVGWVSFPNKETIRKKKEEHNRRRTLQITPPNYENSTDSNSSGKSGSATTTSKSRNNTFVITDLFRHVFLDANRARLREALGIPPRPLPSGVYDGDDDQFQTQLGREVAEFIQDTRDSMELTTQVGCAPRDYLLNQSMVHEDSLWRLYRDEVGPHALVNVKLEDDIIRADKNRALLVSQDSWRYGLYGGDHLTNDDIIVVSPFNEPIYRVAVLPCLALQQLHKSMNADTPDNFYNTLPAWILSGNLGLTEGEHRNDDCELYVNHFGLSRVHDGLHKMDSLVEWNPIESNLTTTSIWFLFVADRWQCPGTHSGIQGMFGNMWGSNKPSNNAISNDHPPKYDHGSIMIAIAILAVTIVSVGYLIVASIRRKQRCTNGKTDYDGVVQDVDNDDNDLAMRHDGKYSDGINEVSSEDDDCPVRIV